MVVKETGMRNGVEKVEKLKEQVEKFKKQVEKFKSTVQELKLAHSEKIGRNKQTIKELTAECRAKDKLIRELGRHLAKANKPINLKRAEESSGDDFE